MASHCNRFIARSSLSSIKSAIRSSVSKSRASTPTSHPLLSPPRSAPRRFPFSRAPSELGGVMSMLPLHNAVATSRMTSCLSATSRSCRALSQGTLCCTSPGL